MELREDWESQRWVSPEETRRRLAERKFSNSVAVTVTDTAPVAGKTAVAVEFLAPRETEIKAVESVEMEERVLPV